MDLVSKGRQLDYDYPTINTIDLSQNNVSGEIPIELTNLSKLDTLNLSLNHLTGKIPENIGDLQYLETLDLSCNLLSGPIPQSMTSITALSSLNLSYNDLSGQIPTANQFQSFNDPSNYAGLVHDHDEFEGSYLRRQGESLHAPLTPSLSQVSNGADVCQAAFISTTLTPSSSQVSNHVNIGQGNEVRFNYALTPCVENTNACLQIQHFFG
nr:leucine-rich repeat receptor-like protein FASCIATED EAR2 [Quercus suber]